MGRGIDMNEPLRDKNGLKTGLIMNKAGNNILGFFEDKVVFVGSSKQLE